MRLGCQAWTQFELFSHFASKKTKAWSAVSLGICVWGQSSRGKLGGL